MAGTGFKSLFCNTRNKLANILVIAASAILIFFALISGYVFWYMHTAKPAKEFCGSVKINSDLNEVQARAKAQGFELKEQPGKAGYEKMIVFSKRPNGESQCQVYIKENRIVKKRYVLYL